jgi:hypothetical protein
MEGGPTISHLGVSRPKKRELTAPTANTVLPMELQVDGRLADQTGAWEVVGRPYTKGRRQDRARSRQAGRRTRQRRRAERAFDPICEASDRRGGKQ